MSKNTTIILTREINKNHPVQTQSTQEVAQPKIFGIQIPQGNSFDLLLFYILIFLLVFVITFILKVSLSYIFGALVFLLPTQNKCPKCGKLFKTKNLEECPYCHAKLHEEIRGH
ncbi:MAG: hypothetical protein SPL73_05955 [Cyanobacteriota bacterium]|nr:hypothetical protein [Cyanobacteriota bacterium]MDY6358473.1 hypothetical protein [Cyanobacteriota bacterium]MDY6364416.1 hypothetical protein [Cyanobacteriota bacterium]MDY6383437.1 hypothetical protein [Cyanobacteriota bacterium]